MTATSREGVRTMPNDLISRSALLPAIESYFEPINPDHPMTLTIEQIREVLNLLPAVDAVPVVRCGECKKRNTAYCSVDDWTLPCDDDFCSYGKRKDGESNDE